MTDQPSRKRAYAETEVRINLAAAYRLAALGGWDDTIYTHLSATVPGEPGVYLINEFGLGFDEVCASGLVKVDVQGNVVDGTSRRVNPSGFAIHGAVHAGLPDVECVLHLHAPWGVALGCFVAAFSRRRHGHAAVQAPRPSCVRRACAGG